MSLVSKSNFIPNIYQKKSFIDLKITLICYVCSMSGEKITKVSFSVQGLQLKKATTVVVETIQITQKFRGELALIFFLYSKYYIVRILIWAPFYNMVDNFNVSNPCNYCVLKFYLKLRLFYFILDFISFLR